ncbi:MAG: hypothetical protein C5B52_10435 [Bacteroidetes bacterium]|nr:MAG: hypothetical protein C5B52_10435 [Bacteroidota bacterium]
MENYATSPVITPAPQRPVLLTILCILTFLGSSWGIIGGFTNYITADTASQIAQKAIDDARERADVSSNSEGARITDKVTNALEETLKPENIRVNAIFKVISCILNIIGAFLMIKLMRAGFWVYVLGTLVGVVGVFTAYGVHSIVGLFLSSGATFVGILFVVLYSLNLKVLK